MDRRRKAQQRKRIDMIGIEQDRNGNETRRSERQRNGTESLRQDPKRKSKNTAPAESGRKDESMAKFKVGDRVEVISTKYYTAASIGDKGTVMKVDFSNGDDLNYAVRMDRKNLRYHTCNGLVPWGYGQNLWGECLKLVEEKPTREFKLIITSSGDTTTAKLIHGKTTTKEATVTRYSKDEYSEKAAVEAVVDKIFEKKVDWFNGKVVCVSYIVEGFTKGKIYECIEGKLTSDSGDKMGAYTIEKMKNSHLFLPIVE